LNIDQQFAEIGVRSVRAKVNISSPRMQMRIRTETPQMSIDRKAPSFIVNRSKYNTKPGLKAPLDLAKSQRNKGRQAAFRSAQHAKDDGNVLANTKLPVEKSMQILAKNKMKRTLQSPDVNLGSVSTSPREVTFDKGHMRINWSKHSVAIDWDGEYMPQMTVDPKYSVEVYLRTQPYFRVMVEEVIDPNAPGRYIDQAI